MGILLEKCREKVDVSYQLMGIAADVAQLGRAYLRNESKGKKRNINQIIKKLEKVRDSLF